MTLVSVGCTTFRYQVLGGALGGHGMGHGTPGDVVIGGSGDVAVLLDSCSRPRSYNSCAAGGRLG